MITSLIQTSDWAYLKDFVSPSFFNVLRARDLAKEVSALAKSSLSGKKQRKHIESGVLNEEGTYLWTLHREGAVALDQTNRAIRKSLGEDILLLYFSQLYLQDFVFLDLSPKAFTLDHDKKTTICWDPSKLWVKWDKVFRKALLNMYQGFYLDDEALFDAALKDLNLLEAKDLFVKHFGGDDQSKVTFRRHEFIKTFHEIFEICLEKDIRLHRNFLSLGVYLATLYESLELLGASYDVRTPFMKVYHYGSE